MKPSYFFTAIIFTLLCVSPALAQFDDLYFDREKAKKERLEVQTEVQQKSVTSDIEVNEPIGDDYYGYEFDEESEYYSDYDYAYTTRIRRFHRPQPPLRYYTSFDYWYNDYYYDPFYDNNYTVNVFIGGPVFGWNRWNRWNSYNSWGRWNRWNRWNSWDVWAYNDPWGWNSWGWNSWNYCPPTYGYWGNNVYYTNVYNNYYNNGNNGNNVGGNNGGWGSNGVATKVINQSRRDGALVTSSSGRGSTRRITPIGGTNPTGGTNPGLTNDKQGLENTRTEPRATSRVYKGDIKNTNVSGSTRTGNDTRGNDSPSPGVNKGSQTNRKPVEKIGDENSTRTSSRPEHIKAPETKKDRNVSPSNPDRKNESSPSKREDAQKPSQNRTNRGGGFDTDPSPEPSPRKSGGGFDSGSSRSSSPSRSNDNNDSSRSSNSSSRSGGGFESSPQRSSGAPSGGYDSGSRSSSRSSGGFDSGSSRSSSGNNNSSSGSSQRSGGSSRGGGRG